MEEIARLDHVYQYNELMGIETLHPLVSVIDMSKCPRMRHSRRLYGFYCIFLKDVKCGDLRYGRNYYDYQEGTLVFTAPGQVVGVEDNGEVFQPKGWALLFHPDLIRGTSLGRITLLRTFIKEIHAYRYDSIRLYDSFELRFRIVENGNDTGFIEKIANVGSEGTDILVKAMINIMLLNVFKEGASRKFKDFKLHCMMDEIGKLHPNNISGILKFANDRNIILINGSPTELNRDAYKHVYLLTKGTQNKTRIARLISDKQL